MFSSPLNFYRMSIEKKVADAILQRDQQITLHNVRFDVQQPTIATLIEISELVAQLPETEGQNPLAIMQDLKNCEVVGKIFATLIMGVKKRKWYDFRYKSRKERLSNWIVNNCTPNELCGLLGEVMKLMQLADFFVLTASLRGTSLTRVAETTTVYGR